MTLKDQRGNPVSHGSPEAVRRLDRAIDLLAAYQADPVAELDAVLAEHPALALGHAIRAGIMATTTDRTFDPELVRSLEAAEALAAKAGDRERGHVAAARAWLDGDFERAIELWSRVAIAYPRDLTATQFAHLGDFYLGYSHMLRDRVARVLPQWDASVPGYGYMLGMHAFGLEESGDYAAAERAGRQAVALNGKDGWAVHAVTHVMEMQGRAAEGAKFLGQSADVWAPGSLIAFHNWWHLALFHLDMGDWRESVRLFDEKISAGGFGQSLELLDGCGLLWRLRMLGHDVGARWNDLADKWRVRIDHGNYVFNDLFAMMAFIGAGRADARDALLRSVERAAELGGTNAMMVREVGLPAIQGIEAFDRGDYRAAIDLLLPLRAKSNRFGGSHAQRDLFSWTLTEAAIRSGDKRMAQAMVAERRALKPDSQVNRAWVGRVESLSDGPMGKTVARTTIAAD